MCKLPLSPAGCLIVSVLRFAETVLHVLSLALPCLIDRRAGCVPNGKALLRSLRGTDILNTIRAAAAAVAAPFTPTLKAAWHIHTIRLTHDQRLGCPLCCPASGRRLHI
jgi:hypothetical protein